MSVSLQNWIAVLLLALLLGGLMLRRPRSGRFDPAHIGMIGGVLMLGLIGYGIDGRPDLPAQPTVTATLDRSSTSAFEKSRQALLQNAGDVGAWLMFADVLTREGHTEDAVSGLQFALNTAPHSGDLWVGLGQALTMHAGGFVTPAARLAFNRASQFSPDSPAPQYFLGLAWLQEGNAKAAIAEWQKLRATSPASAPWLPDLDEKIAAAQAMGG